jgi:hypothetical protein
MPRKQRRDRGRRPVVNFEGVDRAERTRWATGTILVKGEIEPIKYSEAVDIRVWASWSSWARVYRTVREAFLSFYHERHGEGEEPGSEALYRAFLAGEDPGEVELRLPPDPRYLLALKPRAHR